MHVGPNNDNDLLASLTPTDNDLLGPESMDVGPNNDNDLTIYQKIRDYLNYKKMTDYLKIRDYQIRD